VALIATTSIIQIAWKEVAEAYGQGNLTRVRLLYGKIGKSMYFATFLLSGLFIPFSKELLSLLLGPAYVAGWLALAIMFFYPIQQTLGHINGSMLYAMGKTRVKSRIGIGFMLTSMVVTYVMLAPRDAAVPGLQLGAVGLSLKMVLCALVEVNLMALFVGKYIGVPFDWTHQVQVTLVILGLAFLSKFLMEGVLGLLTLKGNLLLTLAASGLLYLGLTGVALYHRPALAGMNAEQVAQGWDWIKQGFAPAVNRR
jgi:O-antigen/teichoic acid export membrane protein